MELLVLITNNTEKIPSLLSAFMENNINGATVIDCNGMLSSIDVSNVEPPQIFGSLRKFINQNHENNKMVWVMSSPSKIEKAKAIIHDKIGLLTKPNTGVMFTLPVLSFEGISEE